MSNTTINEETISQKLEILLQYSRTIAAAQRVMIQTQAKPIHKLKLKLKAKQADIYSSKEKIESDEKTAAAKRKQQQQQQQQQQHNSHAAIHTNTLQNRNNS